MKKSDLKNQTRIEREQNQPQKFLLGSEPGRGKNFEDKRVLRWKRTSGFCDALSLFGFMTGISQLFLTSRDAI